jgi:hypothetical protein
MKTLGVSFGISALLCLAAFFGLSTILDKKVATQLAAAMLAIIPHIREFLEKTWGNQRNSTTAPVLSLQGFGLPPQRMILYGILIVFGAMQFGSALGGLSAIALGETGKRQLFYIIAIVANLFQLPIIFAIGKWIGRRCASHGITVILLISFFVRLVTMLFDIWLLTPVGMGALIGSEFKIEHVGLSVLGGTLVLALIMLAGYWFGKRQRFAAYLNYLLGNVPEETREAIVDLAFQEARLKLSPTK